MNLRLRISAAAEKQVRAGHPWVYDASIREQNREGESGELAVIYDRNDRFLAIGFYDPQSPLRVRIVHRGKPQAIDKAWWRRQLQLALDKRKGLFDDQTNGYRCVHGESDGFPGLVLDRYAAVAVLKLYTAAWFPRIGEIIDAIKEVVRPESLVLRLSRNLQSNDSPAPRAVRKRQGAAALQDASRPKMITPNPTGFGVRQPPAAFEHLQDGHTLVGPPVTGSVTFLENGLRFEADVVRGQKTGFFLDQRENRREIGTLAAGREVLNAFSFSGGFSVYAARGDATKVTDLDISAHALESARRNLRLNTIKTPHETIQADAFDWLEETDRKFDLIVLDPPSLAKREAERSTAIRAYTRLASQGIKRLRSRGILLACSCSAHVSAAEFFAAVKKTAVASRRKHRVLRMAGHPPDHPATFPEAEYLKAIYLQFEPVA